MATQVRSWRFRSARLKQDTFVQELLSTRICSGGWQLKVCFSCTKPTFGFYKYQFIINLGDGSNSSFSEYEQVVKVEVCLSEGFACDIVADGHQTVCRQKFSSHRLLALNGSGLEYLDTFLFPAACICHKIGTPMTYLRSRVDNE